MLLSTAQPASYAARTGIVNNIYKGLKSKQGADPLADLITARSPWQIRFHLSAYYC
jgi:hypothetical protein